jgi:hypothetical protein
MALSQKGDSLISAVIIKHQRLRVVIPKWAICVVILRPRLAGAEVHRICGILPATSK